MIYYGLACLFIFLLTAWANADAKGRYADALGMSALLIVSYGLTNVMVLMSGLPDAILGFPIVDLIFTMMIFRAWKRENAAWKLIVAGLFVAQLTFHASFIVSWYSGHYTSRGLYIYIVMLNGAFALQLLTVGSSGARHAVGRIVDYLSDRGRAYSGSHG